MRSFTCLIVLALLTGCASDAKLRKAGDGIARSIFPRTRRYMAADAKLKPEDRQVLEDAMKSFEEALAEE